MMINTSAKLTVEDGKHASTLKFEIPLSFLGGDFEGSNFAFSCDDNAPADVIINYHLCDHFEIFRHDITDDFTGLGYSNLFSSPEEPFKLTVTYKFPDAPEIKALIACDTDNKGRILRFNISLSEEMQIDDAVYLGNSIMSDFFDRISFYLKIPIAHKSISVYAKDTNKLIRTYVTIPYTKTHEIKPDLFRLKLIPDLFLPLLAKYREGMNSISPLYRCLCYYSTYEGLQIIQREFSKKLKSEKKDFKRSKIEIEDNDLTREVCPSFIGKNVHKFFQEYVQKEFRNSIAHMFDKEFSTAPIKPMAIEIIHTLDNSNQVMSKYLPILIQQEIDFFLANQ